jgi:hypothetical protein
LFNLKKRVKDKTHVETLICEAYIVEEISTSISYCFKPHEERESTAFHDMMMVMKCLPVRTYQYSPILDDQHLKMPQGEDICLK